MIVAPAVVVVVAPAVAVVPGDVVGVVVSGDLEVVTVVPGCVEVDVAGFLGVFIFVPCGEFVGGAVVFPGDLDVGFVVTVDLEVVSSDLEVVFNVASGGLEVVFAPGTK